MIQKWISNTAVSLLLTGSLFVGSLPVANAQTPGSAQGTDQASAQIFLPIVQKAGSGSQPTPTPQPTATATPAPTATPDVHIQLKRLDIETNEVAAAKAGMNAPTACRDFVPLNPDATGQSPTVFCMPSLHVLAFLCKNSDSVWGLCALYQGELWWTAQKAGDEQLPEPDSKNALAQSHFVRHCDPADPGNCPAQQFNDQPGAAGNVVDLPMPDPVPANSAMKKLLAEKIVADREAATGGLQEMNVFSLGGMRMYSAPPNAKYVNTLVNLCKPSIPAQNKLYAFISGVVIWPPEVMFHVTFFTDANGLSMADDLNNCLNNADARFTTWDEYMRLALPAFRDQMNGERDTIISGGFQIAPATVGEATAFSFNPQSEEFIQFLWITASGVTYFIFQHAIPAAMEGAFAY